MHVLIVKTSSMGDIIHTLPALTDAGKAYPDIRFDWVVEENFAEIPRWHSLVENVIPVAVRRWRKNILSQQTRTEIKQLKNTLRLKKYDLIIDAQGLFKTLWISWLAKGPTCGLDRHSAREPLTSFFYNRTYSASWQWHAVTRIRHLFSQALGYPLSDSIADYGLDRQRLFGADLDKNYLVFLHGTTWATKHWPEEYWCQLAKLASDKGFRVKLPWGNEVEKQRAERIAASCQQVEVLPRLGLVEIASVLAGAKGVVAVDTGLGHLSAALDVPAVSLYGPTDPVLIGTMGRSQVHLSAKFSCAPCASRECSYQGPKERMVEPPCFSSIPPLDVWNAVCQLIII